MTNSIKTHGESQIFCGEQDEDNYEVKNVTAEANNVENYRRVF
jgi:hypothetical protein